MPALSLLPPAFIRDVYPLRLNNIWTGVLSYTLTSRGPVSLQFHKEEEKKKKGKKKAAYPGWWIVKPALYTVAYTVCVIPNNKKLFSTNFPLLLKPSFFPPFQTTVEATSGRQMWSQSLFSAFDSLSLPLSPLPGIHCFSLTLSQLSLSRVSPSPPLSFWET